MTLGARGERVAARYLKRHGLRIITRNYTCPAGEIDIVAQDGDTIVFVEVKTRASSARADPEVNVTAHKRRKLASVARYYLLATRQQDHPCRFDVVSVVSPRPGKAQIEHFADAFSPP